MSAAQPAPLLHADAAPAGWSIIAARRTGESHARRSERGQDAFALRQVNGVLVAAIADGAGSAPRGGAGAALAVRSVAQSATRWLAGKPLNALTEADVETWVDSARERLAQAASRNGHVIRDCATTLILCLSDGGQTLVAHIGDGAAVARDEASTWQALSWPAGGEHAGSTYFLTEEPPALRLTRHATPVTALALFTDGLERLVLDFAEETAHGPFFDRIAKPLDSLTAPGRDAALSRALGAWLGGEGVAARTDDDRTLILARPLEAAR
jgi:hypothetical protein